MCSWKGYLCRCCSNEDDLCKMEAYFIKFICRVRTNLVTTHIFKICAGWLLNFIPLSANIYPLRHAINQVAKKSESFIRTSRPRNCRRIHNYFLIKICFPLLSLPHFALALCPPPLCGCPKLSPSPKVWTTIVGDCVWPENCNCSLKLVPICVLAWFR